MDIHPHLSSTQVRRHIPVKHTLTQGAPSFPTDKWRERGNSNSFSSRKRRGQGERGAVYYGMREAEIGE